MPSWKLAVAAALNVKLTECTDQTLPKLMVVAVPGVRADFENPPSSLTDRGYFGVPTVELGETVNPIIERSGAMIATNLNTAVKVE